MASTDAERTELRNPHVQLASSLMTSVPNLPLSRSPALHHELWLLSMVLHPRLAYALRPGDQPSRLAHALHLESIQQLLFRVDLLIVLIRLRTCTELYSKYGSKMVLALSMIGIFVPAWSHHSIPTVPSS